MKIIRTWSNLKWSFFSDERIDVQEDDSGRLRTKRSNSGDWSHWDLKKDGVWSKELLNTLDNTASDTDHTKPNEEQSEGISSLRKWKQNNELV